MVSSPASGASRSCLRISDDSFGISIACSMRCSASFGNAEQDQRRAVGVALIVPFHRHDLRGLVLERVEAVQVADEDLHRRDQRRHPHRHREHLARVRLRASP